MSSETPGPPPAGFLRRGFLVVVSGPSGVGKTSFCSHLLETRTDTVRSISATTRQPGEGERDGRDYAFLERAEFERRVAAGEFLEHAEVHGHLYGTPRRFVEESIAAGKVVLLNIDVQGGLQVKARHPDGVFIIVYPPSLEALRMRLESRRREDGTDIERRLTNAPGEMQHYKYYDYVVVNEDLPAALAQVSAIVQAERARVTRLAPIGPKSAVGHGA
ncbi:MAG: guanylate kinase [Candidatus Eiseniibacteriota bacterium]